MNKKQREVQNKILQNEREILQELERIYGIALTDIMARISDLMARDDLENLQSIIYQVEYQKALKTQISTILDQLTTKEFETISAYLTACYEEAFIGTLYDLQNQGIPLIFPINQKKVVEAVKLNSKLSTNLYNELKIGTEGMKKVVRTEISRGVSQNYTYNKIAQNIKNSSGTTLNNAMRITRTEGHRITQNATYDVQVEAKKKGAKIKKQWDSTLDYRTRPSHQKLDGVLIDIDEKFKTENGYEALHPSGFGVPEEDINCRCCLLQRAEWNIDPNDSFTKYVGEKTNDIVEFENLDDYEKFKKEFWKRSKKE